MADLATPTDLPLGPTSLLGSGRRWRWLLPLGILLVVAGIGGRYWLLRPQDQALALSGRIEGYEINLGPKTGGLVAMMAVREGDAVQAGQIVAQLDDQELQAQLAAAQASYAVAQQQVTQAQLQLEVIDSQIQEAQLTLQQAQGDTSGRVNQAAAVVATAQAQLAMAQAQRQQAMSALNLAQIERDRFATLVAAGAVAQQQFDQVQTQLATAQDILRVQQGAVAAAERQVQAAQGMLTQAQTTQLNPNIRTVQVARLQTQRDQALAQLAAAQAEVERTQATQAEIAARIEHLTVVSPIDGVVVTRTGEPGEVIAGGTTLLTVMNLDQVYLRGYIPEGRLGEVRVGQAAQIFLDSAPDQPLAATVDAIDTAASFTPENIYFQSDRVTQVFGLRLGIANPDGFAKPGMPADGEILLGE